MARIERNEIGINLSCVTCHVEYYTKRINTCNGRTSGFMLLFTMDFFIFIAFKVCCLSFQPSIIFPIFRVDCPGDKVVHAFTEPPNSI